jgi:MFS transporter, OFA family, oxalate/formate antiporter
MYTAKGTAALLVPLANVLVAAQGSWHGVFMTAMTLNFLAALMAIFVLKPMRAAYTNRNMGSVGTSAKLATP